MFSLEQFYEDAYGGNKVDENEFCEYLRSFDDIVIWGAGNLGTAVGQKLQQLGIVISAYWDAHYFKIKEKNGVPVIETYTGDFLKEKTLVLFCIANVPVSPKLFNELKQSGWENVIKGLAILEGVICPFNNESEIDTGICNSMDMCTVCNCSRLSSIMQNQICKRKNILKDEILSFDRIHFIINNFCNLKCTHCFMYMNSYPTERKRNVSLDIMKRDIKMVFEAIDSFGVVNVFGGEPFLHPELSQIVKEILKNKSFGSMIVNTNGLANMKQQQLEGLEDKRIRLAFSNYLEALSTEQKERLEANFELAKKYEIIIGMQNELPTWNISSTLSKNSCTEDELREYKQRCGVKFLYVHNGKIFPCAMCLSVNDLGIEDYPTDYVDIAECKDAKELREKIICMVNRSYYCSCTHCDQNLPVTAIAGEQGYSSRYALPK